VIEATIKIAGISTGETGDQPLEMNRPPPLWSQAQRGDQVRYGMTERPKPDPNADLHRTLNNACRKWGAREIRLRYLPKPSVNRWIAEALIDHHRVIEKIRADIPAGELTLQDMESFNDQPIARGVGDTAADAIKTMWPLTWRTPRNE